jgi:HlyD family secretion protein
MTDTPPEPVAPRRRLALYVAIPVIALLCWGAYEHWRQRSDARETLHASESFVPDVHVTTATLSRDRTPTILPGQTTAFDSADLFARATGFVAERHVDIGSRVHKGDLLLRIAAPDLDQQLNQARAQLGQMQAALAQATATLKQAQANTQLARVNKFRATTLAGEGWGTRQSADTETTNASVSVANVASAQAGIGVAVANIRAQQATVDRLVALTGFEQVVAPFDGVITQRDVDVGDLVQSDTNSGTPLFHIDLENVLRCDVYVPQSQFAGIHEALDAAVTVPELPGRVFRAKVSRSSASLAQNSRSMLVEIDIPNDDGVLAPGLYVNVAFDIARTSPAVVVADATLIFDAKGLHVAIVTEDQRIRMAPVVVARDFGEKAELREGLKGGEALVMNPPPDLEDGQKVHVASGQSSRGQGGGKSKS